MADLRKTLQNGTSNGAGGGARSTSPPPANKHIARVASLMETAHTAIREPPAARLEQAYHDIAQVVWAGLPRAVRGRISFDLVMYMTHELRAEADPWAAAVNATSKVLGWSDSARAQAAHAIRVALLARR